MAPPSHVGKTRSDKVGDKRYTRLASLFAGTRSTGLNYRNCSKKHTDCVLIRAIKILCKKKKDDAVPR